MLVLSTCTKNGNQINANTNWLCHRPSNSKPFFINSTYFIFCSLDTCSLDTSFGQINVPESLNNVCSNWLKDKHSNPWQGLSLSRQEYSWEYMHQKLFLCFIQTATFLCLHKLYYLFILFYVSPKCLVFCFAQQTDWFLKNNAILVPKAFLTAMML